MMKKMLLSFVAATSLLVASDYSYELTIGGGINDFADSRQMKDAVGFGHASLQFNDFMIKPQLVVERVMSAEYAKLNLKTHLNRAFVNGVYEFMEGGFVPYALAGLGYEDATEPINNRLKNAILLNGGVGFKIPVGGVDLKVEGRYMKRVLAGDTHGHEMVALAGVSIPFGAKTAPAPVVEEKPVAESVPEVVPEPTPEPTPPADSDNDGVTDNIDKCPNTAPNAKVDEFGCPEVFKLDDLRFKSGSAQIDSRYVTDLTRLVKYLNDNPLYNVEIAGHTDNRGSDKFNQKLSDRRANAVKKYVIDKGIEAGRVSATGYGESQPIADNKTAEGRKLNRRVVANIFVAK